jgi:hypothetical protein
VELMSDVPTWERQAGAARAKIGAVNLRRGRGRCERLWYLLIRVSKA